MGGKEILRGRVWKITDSEGKLIDDIDTDQIYHNAHLAITDLNEMGKYAFGNLKGWEDFPQKTQRGDILLVGSNFGAGSSRQQAVDCFISLGIQLIIGRSFGAIYKRNAINAGFPILICFELEKFQIKNSEMLEANLKNGVLKNIDTGVSFWAQKMSDVQMEIYLAGNLFNYGKTK